MAHTSVPPQNRDGVNDTVIYRMFGTALGRTVQGTFTLQQFPTEGPGVFDQYLVPAHWEDVHDRVLTKDGFVTIVLLAVGNSPNGTEVAVGLGGLRLELEAVHFKNNHVITKDDGSGQYADPQWLDSDPFDYNPAHVSYPVCYTSGTKMRLDTKWKMQGSASIAAQGTGSGGYNFPATSGWEEFIQQTGERWLWILDVDCVQSFPGNKVDYLNPVSIQWTFQPDAYDRWINAGVSENPVYVTLRAPTTPNLYHTVVHLSCVNASGQVADPGAADAIYGEFTDRVVRRLSDNAQMTYWFNDQMGATETPALLARPDANGNCQAWSALLRDCLRVQGIAADRIRALPVSASDSSILVKNWGISDPAHGTGQYPYIVGTDAFDQTGVAGQGNANPSGAFNGHWITLCNSVYYDPSYGTSKVTGANKNKDYEDASLAGYGAQLPPSNGTGVRKNDTSTNSVSELSYEVNN
jgi:hypothetical protein